MQWHDNSKAVKQVTRCVTEKSILTTVLLAPKTPVCTNRKTTHRFTCQYPAFSKKRVYIKPISHRGPRGSSHPSVTTGACPLHLTPTANPIDFSANGVHGEYGNVPGDPPCGTARLANPHTRLVGGMYGMRRGAAHVTGGGKKNLSPPTERGGRRIAAACDKGMCVFRERGVVSAQSCDEQKVRGACYGETCSIRFMLTLLDNNLISPCP